jgi:hypothetical protein
MALLSLGQQIAGELFDTRVGYEPHLAGYALLFTVALEGRHGGAGVRPYLYLYSGPSISQATDQALQDGHTGVGCVSVPRSKERRDQVPALAVEDQKRMIHVLRVIAVVVGTFLLPVGRIVRGVEVQKHLLGGPSLPRSLR